MQKATVIYDGECGLCLCTRRYLEPLDFFHSMRWIPYQSPEALAFGIPLGDLEHHVHVICGGRTWKGFEATKQVLLRLPAFWAVGALALWRSPKIAGPLLALYFSPLFRPAGDALYDFVSERRHHVPRNLCGAFTDPETQVRELVSA